MNRDADKGDRRPMLDHLRLAEVGAEKLEEGTPLIKGTTGMSGQNYSGNQTNLRGSELFRLIIHQAEEKRSRDWLDQPSDDLMATIYIHAKAHRIDFQPKVTFEFHPHPDEKAIIRGVIPIDDQSTRLEYYIGQARAWIYSEEHVGLLLECYLLEPYCTRQAQLAFWRAIEKLLLERGNINEVYTPGWNLMFDVKEYHELLSSLGYNLSENNFYKKSCDRNGPTITS